MASSHAELMKLIIGYTFVGALVFTVVVTCLSLVGWIKFADKQQQSKLFSVLILELVTIGLGSFAGFLELSPAEAKTAIETPLKEEVAEQRQVNEMSADKLQAAVMEGLRPEAVMQATRLVDSARAAGIELKIISGYRSPQQQAELYARGRTAPGSRVTNTRVSSHNTGLAFDVAIVRNGRPVFDDVEDYKVVGALGERLGLVWGGSYRPVPDYPHFETRSARAATAELRRQS